MHKGLELLGEVRQKSNISTELSFRWLVYHSMLGDGDGVILEASKVEQIEGNCAAIENGVLSDDIVGELDGLCRLWSF